MNYKIRLPNDQEWDDDGEGWLFPLKCPGCHKKSNQEEFLILHQETEEWR